MVSPKSVKRFKIRVRELTGRNTGRSLEQLIQPLKRYLTGWKSYYKLNQCTVAWEEAGREISPSLSVILCNCHHVKGDRSGGHRTR